MASNDGKRLLVLGLTFRQHHTLHMQQVLRAYDRLPDNPMDRGALYTGLFELAIDLDENETQNLENWLKNGGEFPAPTPRHLPTAAIETVDLTGDDDDEDALDEEGYFPVYNPYDFEPGPEEEDTGGNGDEPHDLGEQARNRTVHGGRSYRLERFYNTLDGDVEDDGNEGHVEDEDVSEELDENERLVDQRWGLGNEDQMNVQPNRHEPNRHGIFDPLGLFNFEGEGRDLGIGDPLDANPRTRRKAFPSGEIIECLICADEHDSTEFPPSTQVTAGCCHENDERVCNYCLQQSIETAVTEGQLHLIICPFCPEKLSHNEVKQYATREIFARYEYLNMMATPDLVMCLGLNCGSGQIHTSDDPMMVCASCSFKTCAIHKLPWHEGQSCEEFDMDDSQIERLEEAEATAKLLAKEHAQVCPNCQNGVSRTEGCDHMTCRCGNEWCYLCGTSYEKIKRLGEEAHALTCMYHPRRIQTPRNQEATVQGQLTQLVHGGPVSETLEKARGRRNERVRAELRPLAAQAAERRMREMEQNRKEEKGGEKKRRLNLHAPWEER